MAGIELCLARISINTSDRRNCNFIRNRGGGGGGEDVAFQLMRKIFTTVHMSAIRRYIRDDAFIIRVNGASPRRREVYYITDVTFYGSYR